MPVQSNGIGMTRYSVEYLDAEKGMQLLAVRRGDDEHAGLWDYVDQDEITVQRAFPDKESAIAWAQRNAARDVFNMPRIREMTLTRKPGDKRHNPVTYWERTGYWEIDGDEVCEVES